MKILNLKINHFGKLKNKEIQLQDNINIIYGKNESGKSTLLKFILGMFYGLSKNKNGKEIPDFEQYTPWEQGDFSGKVKYQLEDKKTYEVFREFKKKTPKIYNEDLEDISKNFTVDKTMGNRFFYDQTGVEEELFTSTIVSMQNEVRLNDKEQSSLVQKLSNLASTGEDNTSFQKVMNQLSKRELEEIGTQRSQDRPINVITKRLEEIVKEKEYLSVYVEKKYDIEESKHNLEEEIRQQEINMEILKQLKRVKDENELEKEKVKINESTVAEYKRKIDELSYPKKEVQEKKKSNKFSIQIAISFILILLSIICVFVIKNDVISSAMIVLAVISIVSTSYQQYKDKMAYHGVQINPNVDKEKTKSEVEVLLTMIDNLEKERETLKKEQEANYKKATEKIRNAYLGIVPIKVIDELLIKQDIVIEIEVAQNKINENKLKIQSISLDRSNIIPKLENLAELEEENAKLEEEYEELMSHKRAIELAKQEIEKAYYYMRKKVTPQFTNKLSLIMEKISDGKYTNIKLDEKDGMIVETANGSYIPITLLSIGTIDQLYLSLRLGAGENISEESLPIILDEAFAYYDNQRLSNILEYMYTEYPNRQIILFTCTRREKEILDANKIPYNIVELV